MKYDNLTLWEQIVASQHSRVEVEVPGEGGRGWARTGSSIDPANDPALGPEWRRDIQAGARHLRDETYVRFSEPHMDAKLWPVVHPYGTGSLLSEAGSGMPHKHAKNASCLSKAGFEKSRFGGSGS